MSKVLMKILLNMSARKPDDWNLAIQDIIIERQKHLPEHAVVESLRAYLDALWCGPEEQKRLWKELMVSLRKLDEEDIKRNEAHLQKLHVKYANKGV